MSERLSIKEACVELKCTPALIKELGGKGAITLWQPGGPHTRVWVTLEPPEKVVTLEDEMIMAINHG